MTDGWEPTRCCVCREARAATLFEVPTDRAPGGKTAIVRCVGCGLRRLNPRPGPEELREFYGEDYYAYVGRARPPWKQTVWELLRDVASGRPRRWVPRAARPLVRSFAAWLFDVNVEFPHESAGACVVDIGCGYGDLLRYLQPRGWTAIGVEFDAAAAQRGREYGVEIHVGELADLELDPNSVDVAILQHSLEHVPEPDRLVGELGRVLRPGGTMHIALPNGAAAGLRAEREAWGCLSNPLHFWYFDSQSLRALLARAGFEVVEIRFRTIWTNHWRLWRAEAESSGLVAATRRIGRFARARLVSRDSGDTLRVIAKRWLSNGPC